MLLWSERVSCGLTISSFLSVGLRFWFCAPFRAAWVVLGCLAVVWQLGAQTGSASGRAADGMCLDPEASQVKYNKHDYIHPQIC